MRLSSLLAAALLIAPARARAQDPAPSPPATTAPAEPPATRAEPAPPPARTPAPPDAEPASKRAADALPHPSESKPAEPEPRRTEVKPEEPHRAEPKAAEPKPPEPKAAEARPAEVKPPEPKKVEAKPAKPKPAAAAQLAPRKPPEGGAATSPDGSVPAVFPARAVESTDGKSSVAADSPLLAAREFYAALLAKDVERLASLSRAPFFFESRSVGSPEEIKKKWTNSLARQPLESLRLYDIEVLTSDEMTRKYGKPPERLSAWPLSGGTLTVGNLSGHAAVVLWRKSGNAWQALAFHD